MNATADYDAARAAVSRTLPAYVSYTVTSHATGMGFSKDEASTIVVRSRDGKIVKGTPPSVKIGSDASYSDDVVNHAPFQLACYRATGARLTSFDGRPAEALSLESNRTCEHDRHGDFDTLYLDPTTRDPLAAVGNQHDDPVSVHLEQRYARTGSFILPSAFDVMVKGSSFMFWLNVTAHQTYTRYAFSNAPP